MYGKMTICVWRHLLANVETRVNAASLTQNLNINCI